MSRGKDILSNAANFPSLTTDIVVHSKLLDIHARALAAHCECLALNAANCAAMCRNESAPYTDNDYFLILQKWNICNDKGEPLI